MGVGLPVKKRPTAPAVHEVTSERAKRAGKGTKARLGVSLTGYSGTPLPTKLGIKPWHHVTLLNAPKEFSTTLGELPEGVTLFSRLPRTAGPNIIIWFVIRHADLTRRLKGVRQKMGPATGLWVAWPKQSSGVETDITENVIREVVLPTGLVDNKVCAIDEIWSGLRLVIRLQHRH